MINCNLQRLDGPVRGNGKIIQELEGIFKGAGWNVVKVLWGSGWDKLIAADTSGILLKRMEEVVDGEYQDFKSKNGAYVREHFFGKYPELAAMVAGWTDEEIWALVRGGHDPLKVYAAYHMAQHHQGQPTVILAKTVKGYGMGEAGEGQNITHQQKKMGESHLHEFADRFGLPLTDEQIQKIPFLTFEPGSAEDPSICTATARRWAATCRPGGSSRPRWRCRLCRRSRRSWRPPASAPSAPPWRSCASSTRCCATRRSAGTWCRSCPTNRAPSAWRGCSASSASSARWASSTGRRMPTS